MKPAQITKDEMLQPARTIVLGETVEVGVKATEYGNPEMLGTAYR
jgi:hypothetical protein